MTEGFESIIADIPSEDYRDRKMGLRLQIPRSLLIESLHIVCQPLSEPFGDASLLKGVRPDADRDILTFDDDLFFTRAAVAPITPDDGGPADVDHPDLHEDLISVTHPSAEVAFEVNRRERKVMLEQDVGVFDAQFSAEEFFHGQMEVMHEAGIVNDSRIVDIAETDLDQFSKRHRQGPFSDTTRMKHPGSF